MKLYYLLSIAFIFFYSALLGQELKPDIKWYSDDPRLGLNDDVADVQVDSDGNVWIITFSEIVRFDSRNYKKINTESVNHSSFLRFNETPSGRKYVYDKYGMVFFIEADSLRAYQNNSRIRKEFDSGMLHDLKFDSLNRLKLLNSKKYFIMDDSLSVTQAKDTFKLGGHMTFQIKTKDPIFYYNFDTTTHKIDYQQDKRKSKSIASYKKRKKFIIIDSNQKLINLVLLSPYKYSLMPSFVQSKNGDYILSTGFGHLFRITSSGIIKPIDFDPRITRMFIDSKGNLWISTKGQGIFFIPNGDFNSKQQYHFLEGETAAISAEDKEGGIWGYQENKGFFRLENPRTLFLNYSKIKKDQILDIAVLKTELLISTTNKLYFLNLNNKIIKNAPLVPYPSFPNINQDTLVYSIKYDEFLDQYFITQRGKILKLQNGKFLEIDNYPQLASIGRKIRLAKKIYPQKRAIFGIINKQYFIIKKTENSSYFSEKFKDIIQDIMVVKDSIFLRSFSSLFLISQEDSVNLTSIYPELSSGISDFEYFKDTIWLATKTNGLFKLKRNVLTPIFYNRTDLNNCSFNVQNNSSFWIFNDEGTYNLVDQKLESYRPLPSSSMTVLSNDGNSCFIGTKNKGLIVTGFEDIKQYKRNLPNLNITKFNLGENTFTNIDSTIEVEYRNNSLRVDYNAISYDEKVINYAYRLDGYNSNWTITKNDNIQLVNLDEGNYLFELKARKKNQQWSEIKSIHFVIKPPFYRTWWFIALSASLLISTLSIAIAYRFKTAQREKTLLVDRLTAEQKALRAQMDPHFIFNMLTSIKYLITDETKERAKQFIDMFSDSLRNVLNQANRNNITIGNEISFLTEYIELEKFRLENRFDYEIKTVEFDDTSNYFIPPFILQPFVENAIQHGLKRKKKGHLSLKFEKINNYLQVTIQDNGVGRKKASQFKKQRLGKNRESYGLRIINERLSLHNKKDGNVSITDLYSNTDESNGTLVKVQIRIIKTKQTAK